MPDRAGSTVTLDRRSTGRHGQLPARPAKELGSASPADSGRVESVVDAPVLGETLRWPSVGRDRCGWTSTAGAGSCSNGRPRLLTVAFAAWVRVGAN